MTAKPWFEAQPNLLEREENALTEIGVEYTIDPTALSQGVLRIKLKVIGSNPAFDFNDKTKVYDLVAVFPDSYPYFRPEVFGLNIELPRHQNVLSQGLCLLPRGTGSWEPRWGLAGLLQAQLSKVLSKGEITDPAIIAEDPAEQAEPVSEYYASTDGPVLFDDSQIKVDAVGTSKISYIGKTTVGVPKDAPPVTRLAILAILSEIGKEYKLPEAFSKLFPVKLTGSIYLLPQRPPTGNPGSDLAWLKDEVEKQGDKLIRPKGNVLLSNGFKLTSVTGLAFPEEVEPGKFGTGWLFIVELENARAKGKESKWHAYYSKAARVSNQGAELRVPQLKPLVDKTIAVVGLGALGGPSAIEFARNRIGQLNILDYDYVEPGTAVRWPLGLTSFGIHKAVALHNFIYLNFPGTIVNAFGYRLGVVRLDALSENVAIKNERQVIEGLLENTNLLYDASAEPGINHFLSQEARERGIPYILISATQGAFGGMVFRAVPGKKQGCWMCFQWAKYEGLIPVPPEDDSGGVHIHGCGDVTFTGAGYDLQNISLAGVRLAVATLSSGEPGSLADFDWDVAILRLVDEKKKPISPKWETFKLPVHHKCPYCATES